MAGTWTGTTYNGDETAEKVSGGAANETFYMDGGDDTVSGGAGNDFIEGKGGFDALAGGSGSDTLVGESLRGDDGNDLLVLEAGKGRADGGAGDDLIRCDTILLDGAADTIVGGSGVDYLSAAISSANFKLTTSQFALDGKVIANMSGMEGFYVRFFGAIDRVFKSGIGNDQIATADGDDKISSGSGDDDVKTAGGADTVDAGVGDDVVQLSVGGKDDVKLGAGRDFLRLDEGTGGRLAAGARYDGGANDDTLSIVLDLAPQDAKGVSFVQGVLKIDGKVIATAKNFERYDFAGPSGADSTFTGADGDDVATASYYPSDSRQIFSGGGGDDTLNGDSGSDRLSGGDGDDVLTLQIDGKADKIAGGDGYDRLTYEEGFPAFDAPIRLTGDIAKQATLASAGRTIGEISGIEALELTAGAGDDTINSGGGDDRILGGLGANVINAGAGDDTVSVKADLARDVVDMGKGEDAFTFSGETSAVVMKSDASSMTVTIGGKVAAVVKNAETFSIYGSSGDDSLVGDDGDDTFGTGEGADTVRGGGGDDEISAFLAADGKTDVVFGGAGEDLVSFNALFGSAVTMKAVGQNGFTLARDGKILLRASEVEQVDVQGTSGSDSLVGLTGDDTLRGGAGVDTFVAGRGVDTVDFTGEQAVEVKLVAGKTVIAKIGAAKESLSGVENLVGTQFDDTLTGDSGSNVITDNVTEKSKLDGGGGVDTLVATAFERSFEVDLLKDPNIKNFENLRGSYYYSDTLLGTNGANVISSGGGTDVMTGRGGADSFVFNYISAYTAIKNGDYSFTHAEVTDFSQKEKDRIDVSEINGEDERWSFIGTKAFTGAGDELRVVEGKSDTFAVLDLDGDTLADFAIRISGGVTLTENDFVL